MTPGVFAITENERVRLKCVAGCNGYQAINLAVKASELWNEFSFGKDERYIAHWIAMLAETYTDFGCPECRVVMTEREAFTEFDDELPERYRKTFCDILENPRSEKSVFSHWAVLELSTMTVTSSAG